MKIHKEGYTIILVFFLILAAISAPIIYFLTMHPWLWWLGGILNLAAVIFFGLVIWFFRVPKRNTPTDENAIICPADGKVVVIEKVTETEYLNEECIQISIFMSPLNVHVNFFPISGKVDYIKYHPGKFLVAWHPKSSTENERNTVCVEHYTGQKILFRQIAGAVARRIVNYAKIGDQAEQGNDFGFIKFGSRVDVFVPTSAKINVELEQKVSGAETVVAYLN